MGYVVDYWGSVHNPLLHQDITQHILNTPLRFPNFFDVENVLKNWDLKREIVQAVGIKKPAFVYQRYSRYTYVGLIVAQRFNVPLVLEFNAFAGKSWSVGLKFPELAQKVQDIMLRHSTLIVVVSEVLKDQLEDRGIESDRILINPNGVDVDRFSPQVDGCKVRRRFGLQNKKVIGFIGTFGPWHGAEVLAEAITQISDKNLKDVIFFFIGDGQRRILTQEIIRKGHRESFCIFTGMVPQEQSPNYLAACDLLVSPHVDPEGIRFYGSPTKLFEYMAMGKGIIASHLEQIGDVLEDGETAFLVPPGDAEALAGVIKKALKSPDLCASLGINARSLSENRSSF